MRSRCGSAQAVEYGGGLPPYEVITIVRSAGGLDPIDRPVRRGPNYVLHRDRPERPGGPRHRRCAARRDRPHRADHERLAHARRRAAAAPSRAVLSAWMAMGLRVPRRAMARRTAIAPARVDGSGRRGRRPVLSDRAAAARKRAGQGPASGYAPAPRTGYADPPPVIRATPPRRLQALRAAAICRRRRVPALRPIRQLRLHRAPRRPIRRAAPDLPPSGDPRLANAPPGRDGMLPPPPERFPQRAAPAAEKKGRAEAGEARVPHAAARSPRLHRCRSPSPRRRRASRLRPLQHRRRLRLPRRRWQKEPANETAKTPEPAAPCCAADRRHQACSRSLRRLRPRTPADGAVPH